MFQFLGDSESSRLTFFHQPSIFQEQRAKLGNKLGKGNIHQSFSTSCIYYSDGEKRLSEIPAKAEKIERILGLNLFPKTLRS